MLLMTSQTKSIRSCSSTWFSWDACPGGSQRPCKKDDPWDYRAIEARCRGSCWQPSWATSQHGPQWMRPLSIQPNPAFRCLQPQRMSYYSHIGDTPSCPQQKAPRKPFPKSNPQHSEEIKQLLFDITNFRVTCCVAIITGKILFLPWKN